MRDYRQAGSAKIVLLAGGALVLVALVVVLLISSSGGDHDPQVNDPVDAPEPASSPAPSAPPEPIRRPIRPVAKQRPVPKTIEQPPATKAQAPQQDGGSSAITIMHLQRNIKRVEVGMSQVRRRIASVAERRPQERKKITDELNLELRKLEAKRLEIRRQLRLKGR